MKQQGFDFASPEPMPAHCPTKASAPPPCDPNVDPADVKRLTGQNARLLEMLKDKAEVTNLEMVANGFLRYTNRISDLRDYFRDTRQILTVKCMRRDGGTSWYSLVEEQP